jgi:hypothetical protein
MMACNSSADSYSQHICYHIPNRKFCKIQHSHFDDTHAQELTLALAKHPNVVQKLEVSKCPHLSAKGISTILQTLLDHTNHISRLDLESVTIGDEGLQVITRLLQSDKCVIQWLGLQDNNGSSILSLQAWKGLFIYLSLYRHQPRYHLFPRPCPTRPTDDRRTRERTTASTSDATIP